MLIRFEKEHKYVFDLNMFKKNSFKEVQDDLGWAELINGRLVNIESEDSGFVYSKAGFLYYVRPKWCRKVE